MPRFMRYEHHGEVVWVDADLKGKHTEHCLCFSCEKFKPDTPDNCPIAEQNYQMCVQHNLVTPVYECPKFQAKPEADDLRKAIKRFYSYIPEMVPSMKSYATLTHQNPSDWDEVDDNEIPFLSETFLYAAFGKEDARTIMALINNIVREAGHDPHELKGEAYLERKSNFIFD